MFTLFYLAVNQLMTDKMRNIQYLTAKPLSFIKQPLNKQDSISKIMAKLFFKKRRGKDYWITQCWPYTSPKHAWLLIFDRRTRLFWNIRTLNNMVNNDIPSLLWIFSDFKLLQSVWLLASSVNLWKYQIISVTYISYSFVYPFKIILSLSTTRTCQ